MLRRRNWAMSRSAPAPAVSGGKNAEAPRNGASVFIVAEAVAQNPAITGAAPPQLKW
jgi:hypothetical protein